MITVSSEWRSLSQKSEGELTVLARLYYGDESAFISLIGGKNRVLFGEKFLGGIMKIPKIVSRLIMDTHEHSITIAKFEIDNLKFEPGRRWSDILSSSSFQSSGADQGFYNRRIDLRLAILPGTTSFENSFTLLEKGVMRDIKHTREKTTLEIEDKSNIVEINIDTKITESDATAGFVLPDPSLGKLIPEIYGSHRLRINEYSFVTGQTSVATDWVPQRPHNLVPIYDLGGNIYMVANHETITPVMGRAGFDGIWTKSIIDRPIELSTVSDATAGGQTKIDIGIPRPLSWYDYRLPFEIDAGDSGDFADPENFIDLDVTTKAVAISLDGAVNGSADTIDLNFPANDVELAQIAGIKLAAKYDDAPIAAATHRLFPWGENTKIFLSTGADTEIRLTDGTPTVSTANLEAAQVKFEKVVGFGGGTGGTMNLYALFMRVTISLFGLPFSDLLYGGRGRDYDTWINGRHTDEGFDDIHDDDDGENNLIENFAGVVESALRDIGGLVTAEIDRNSFNTASTIIPAATWKCSTSVIEETKLIDFIFSLCRDARSYVWWQPDGTIKMKVLEDTYTSSDRSIDAREITGLKYDRTPIRDIKTAVNVLYNFDPVGNRLMSETGIAEDTDQQARYNVTQARSLLSYEAKHIHDSTTAVNLRTFLLNNLMQPHTIIKGRLPRHQLDLDLGDIVQFTNLPYNPYGEDLEAGVTRNGQVVYKFCWIYQMGRGEVADFEAIQLHEL